MKESVAIQFIEQLKTCYSDLEETYKTIKLIEDEHERDKLQQAVMDLQAKRLLSLIEYVSYQYPLLFPWKSVPKEKDKDIMTQSGFDLTNPWHENAYLFYGFMCNNCKTQITQSDINVDRTGDRIFEFCVAITDEAKKRGWSHQGQYSFFCPNCATN